MKKYQYTQQEHDAIVAARKGDKKELAKIVNKIRKTCIKENRFTEVEDVRKKKDDSKSKEPAEVESAPENEEQIEVHGAEETSVVIG